MSNPPPSEPPEDDVVWWDRIGDDLFDVLDELDLNAPVSLHETDRPGHLELQVEASAELPQSVRDALQGAVGNRAVLHVVVVDRLDDSEVGIVEISELPPPHEW